MAEQAGIVSNSDLYRRRWRAGRTDTVTGRGKAAAFLRPGPACQETWRRSQREIVVAEDGDGVCGLVEMKRSEASGVAGAAWRARSLGW